MPGIKITGRKVTPFNFLGKVDVVDRFLGQYIRHSLF